MAIYGINGGSAKKLPEAGRTGESPEPPIKNKDLKYMIICLDREEFARIKADIKEAEYMRDEELNCKNPDIDLIRQYDNLIKELTLEIQ